MNREYDYSELIEDYLTGKLSEKQKLEFEAQLKSNPDLNKDLMLQKDIISSIKDARKAELKSMLNNVNVSSGNGMNYFPLQMAGAVLITSLLAVATYFYFSEGNQKTSDRSTIEETTPSNDGNSEQGLPTISNGKGSVNEETTVQQEEPAATQETVSESPEATSTEDGSGTTDATTDTTSDASSKSAIGTETAEGQPGGSGLNVETKKDRNHAFHYQYYEDKLFLYGDFKGNAYEIVKLPTPAGIRLYMSYDGRFYKMEKSRKIKPFELVEDPELIEQLQKAKTK